MRANIVFTRAYHIVSIQWNHSARTTWWDVHACERNESHYAITLCVSDCALTVLLSYCSHYVNTNNFFFRIWNYNVSTRVMWERICERYEDHTRESTRTYTSTTRSLCGNFVRIRVQSIWISYDDIWWWYARTP